MQSGSGWIDRTCNARHACESMIPVLTIIGRMRLTSLSRTSWFDSLRPCRRSCAADRIGSFSTPVTGTNLCMFASSAMTVRAKFWLDPVRLEHVGAVGLAARRSIGFKQLSRRTCRFCWTNGMSISTVEAMTVAATQVTVTDDTLTFELSDGRTISAAGLVSPPAPWFGRGTTRRRQIGRGGGVHLPDLDEDVSVENLLAGKPSGQSQRSFADWISRRAAGKAKSATA